MYLPDARQWGQLVNEIGTEVSGASGNRVRDR